MTRAAWPAAFGRGRVAPLQIDVPQRLPGGIWGPTPLSGEVSWDAQGAPTIVGAQSLVATNQSLLRAEWPIPTRWELQLGLVLAPVSGGATTWTGGTGALNITGSIESSVESASVTQAVSLIFGPGVYPLTAAVQGINGLSSTFPVIGQTVFVRIDALEQGFDVNLAGQTWRWTVSCVCGLTSAGWPG